MAHELGATLGRETDELNNMLMQAAEKLSVYGVYASVALPRNSELAIGKQGNTWRLLYLCGDSSSPLLSCARETRIEAVDYLPALLEVVQHVAAKEVQAVIDAKQRLRVFLGETGE